MTQSNSPIVLEGIFTTFDRSNRNPYQSWSLIFRELRLKNRKIFFEDILNLK